MQYNINFEMIYEFFILLNWFDLWFFLKRYFFIQSIFDKFYKNIFLLKNMNLKKLFS